MVDLFEKQTQNRTEYNKIKLSYIIMLQKMEMMGFKQVLLLCIDVI